VIVITIEGIFSPIQTRLNILDDRLINQISKDSAALCTILQGIFKAGGKRLRPALSFLIYEALLASGLAKDFCQDCVDDLAKAEDCADCAGLVGDPENIDIQQLKQVLSAKQDEKIYLIAEISELIHTASLVHDDIIDNSFVRRGLPTANSKFSNAVTVISGDFMFARAAVNLGKVGNLKIVDLYAKVLEHLCLGEIKQVEYKYSTELNWQNYEDKNYRKTASLFEAAALAPAELLELKPKYKNALASFGREIGLAFQIVDDILDFTSDEQTLGKPAGSDVKEGQINLPVLYALEELQTNNPASGARLKNLIVALSSDNDNQEILNEILSLIDQTEAINKSRLKAQIHVDKAKLELDFLDDSQCKAALLELADFTLQRVS
jgi:all-trans-nonaprenyl-diphosphate synthase